MCLLHKDIILGDPWSDILRNNAYKISKIRKKDKWILLKGDEMMTKWSLKCTCYSVDWMVAERSLWLFSFVIKNYLTDPMHMLSLKSVSGISNAARSTILYYGSIKTGNIAMLSTTEISWSLSVDPVTSEPRSE